jgi:transcriptional regulator with XRE-family HTH domain
MRSSVATDVRHRIVPLRHRLGLSQTAFARQAGIPRNALVEYERGSRVPKSVNLGRIAEAGESSVDWLLNGRVPGRSLGRIPSGRRPWESSRHLARSDPTPARGRDACRARSEMKRDAARVAPPDRPVDRLRQLGARGVILAGAQGRRED